MCKHRFSRLMVSAVVIVVAGLFASPLSAQKSPKPGYAMFGKGEVKPNLLKKFPNLKDGFPVPPGSRLEKKESFDKCAENQAPLPPPGCSKVGWVQTYYTNLDIVKVRDYYKQQLGSAGEVYAGNPLLGAGGNWITIPIEQRMYTINGEQKNVMLYGAQLAWTYNKDGQGGTTRIYIQKLDEKTLPTAIKEWESEAKRRGGPKAVPK